MCVTVGVENTDVVTGLVVTLTLCVEGNLYIYHFGFQERLKIILRGHSIEHYVNAFLQEFGPHPPPRNANLITLNHKPS